MERFSIYTGKNLSIKKYLATWELDNETFDEQNKISKKTALDWFKFSNKSTIVLWDNQEDCLIGYITPFLLNHSFASEYIVSDCAFWESLKKSCFILDAKNVTADLYLFSTAIIPRYRDKKLPIKDKNSKFYNKKVFTILNEALVDWICGVLQQGVSLQYIFGEKVTNDGKKYLNSLGLQLCFKLHNDCKYAKSFTPNMFKKCDNCEKLKDLCLNSSKPFNKNILDNHEYLSIKDNVLHYKDINLLDLANQYGAPLEVAYTPMITEKINYIKNLFTNKIKKYNYPSKYYYAYASKANYYSEVMLTALNDVDMIETSSAYDIELIYNLVVKGYIKKGYTVLCNGFKNEKYISVLEKLLDKGINIIPIIENEDEFKNISKIKNHHINVGIRYNSDFEARLIKNSFKHDEDFDNRFGFDEDKCIELASKIEQCNNLTLQVLHFHFGGSINNIDNFIKGYVNILTIYCRLKKNHSSLSMFDFGGGFPVKYSLTYDFDYDKLVDEIIKKTKDACRKYKVDCPHLIGEHGRITTADHSFYIYKVDFTKQANNKTWYIINGSLMNMTPDIWGTDQEFTILPINLLENNCIPVCLGGETCDPDDRYYIYNKNVKLNMPEINEGQTLYIAVFTIGAYQEIISGIGGLHHCLIPEGKELIIYKGKNKLKYYVIEQIPENKKVLELLDYDDSRYMKRFYKK